MPSPADIPQSLNYYGLAGFAAALLFGIWTFTDSRRQHIDSPWVSFAATLGPLVTLPGAFLAVRTLMGWSVFRDIETSITRNLLWLSIGGGVLTLLAALAYVVGPRARREDADDNLDDYGAGDYRGADHVGASGNDDVSTEPPRVGLQQGGIMIGGASPNETMFMGPEGKVDGVIAWLTYLTDPHRGYEIPLGRDARIGRGNDCEIVIDDGEVSAWHARMQYSDDGRFTLRDVGSTNGTFVNGERIEVHTMNDHDVIRIGGTELEFFWVRQRSDVPGEMAYRASVLLQTGANRGDDVALNQDKMLVGSSPRCDIVLNDQGVAGVHAVFSRDGDGYVLSSIGNAMLRVNGDTVEERVLVDRDEIALGEARLLYRDGIDR